MSILSNSKRLSFYSLIIFSFLACQNQPNADNKKVETATKSEVLATTTIPPTIIPFTRGPYQDNGGSPWYAIIGVGSTNQPLKFGMDTGNNANWVTSIQCQTPACTQPGRSSFDYQNSQTFSFVNTTIDTLEFGPWGNMTVNTGQDLFQYFTQNAPAKMLLSVDYSGEKFAELDWDGGIGFPAQNPDTRTNWLLETMVNQGLLDPNNVYVSFYMDSESGQGNIMIGGYDQTLFDPTSQLSFPFKPYPSTDLAYLWTTQLDAWTVNGETVAQNELFCFDTGSSDFKGDTVATDAANRIISAYHSQNGNYPTMELTMGIDVNGQPGQLILSSDQYVNEIEKGPGKGTEMVSIDTLDIPDLVLVGSVLLESVYTIFQYQAVGTPGNYKLQPVEVWMYNKVNGPTIIQNTSSH